MTPVAASEQRTAGRAAESAALAANYLIHSETDSGAFEYEYDFVAGQSSRDDNIVRQAGATYSLTQYLGLDAKPEAIERAERALGYLSSRSVTYADGKLVSSDGTLDNANTGATALALLAELLFFEATGDQRFASSREAWLRGLIALWQDGVGFSRRPGTTETSPYYDGESWLALAHFARLFPEHAEVRDLLASADARFLVKFAQDPDPGFNHWGLLAAAVRWSTTGSDAFVLFSAVIADWMLDWRPDVHPTGNTCYAVEGLTAAVSVLDGVAGHEAIVSRSLERAEAELKKVFEFQILPNQTQINLGPGRYYFDEELFTKAGAFLNARFALKARVDYTQHCLSGIIGFLTVAN